MNDLHRSWLVAASHLLVAVFYKSVLGLSIEEGLGAGAWQLLPAESLRSGFTESIWSLHSQPPLHNLYWGLLVNLCGENALARMHDVNIVVGSLMCGMVYTVACAFIRQRALAFAVAMALALHPSVFLFEAYPLYTLHSAAWIVTALYCLARHRIGGGRRWLYGFVLCLNLLILTRSVYHPVLLVVAVPLACILAGPRWRSVLVMTIALSAVSVGWYGKNLARFGTFSGSSWGGQSLYKVASNRWSQDELVEMAARRAIRPFVVEIPPFSAPSAHRAYGFDKRSKIAALANDDLHNINVIDISRAYGGAALTLIRERPARYVTTATRSVRNFCSPSARHGLIGHNADRIRWHVEIEAGLLEGDWLVRWVTHRFPQLGDFGSFQLLLLPGALALYLGSLLAGCRTRRGVWGQRLRDDGPMLVGSVLILYTMLGTSLFEYGENNRFKFMVEPIIWPFELAVFWRVAQRWRPTTRGGLIRQREVSA